MVEWMFQVEVYLRVRRAVMVEGMSIREASRVFNLHRDTVRKMLAYSAPPGYRRQVPPRRPKLEPFIPSSDGFWKRISGFPGSSATPPSGSYSRSGMSMASVADAPSSRTASASFDALPTHLGQRNLGWGDARLRGHAESIRQRLERDLEARLPLPAAPNDACDKGAGRVSSLSLELYRTKSYLAPVA